jgi:hypothetical protein
VPAAFGQSSSAPSPPSPAAAWRCGGSARFGSIPLPVLPVLEAIEQNHMVTPGQFCSKLQNLRVRPRLGKGPHVAKIPQSEALHPGKLVAEILGQPIPPPWFPSPRPQSGRRGPVRPTSRAGFIPSPAMPSGVIRPPSDSVWTVAQSSATLNLLPRSEAERYAHPYFV